MVPPARMRCGGSIKDRTANIPIEIDLQFRANATAGWEC
jgi:hypothetical protein